MGSAAALAIVLFASSTAALAQTPATTTAAAVEAEDEGMMVVTGSLFARRDLVTPSPVTVLTSETLANAGITTINDAIRSISADSAGSISTGFTNGFSAGGAAVSLRGLGVSSTLVLIDGLRSTNFPLNDDGHNAYVDLNSIPFSAVERIEVLKDGASSTYGADAIGGVVNIIMRKQFQGIAGNIEGGATGLGDAGRYRASLTAGFGDYAASGWNFYVNGEYQRDEAVSARQRGFPFDTKDLTSIGLSDQNNADNSLSTATVNAVVRLAGQSDLNNPFTGGSVPTGQYTTLNLTNCDTGTFTVAGAAGGVGCKHNNDREFGQIQPFQERYSATGRLSFRLTDDIEGYLTGSYSHSQVNIKRAPAAIRQTQPYGASPSLASNNPGVVLPVYICSGGVNCATAADRQLNPNNPYAATFAANPAAGGARVYYLFGDIPVGTERSNEVIRGALGLRGSFGDGWKWHVDATGAKDNLNIRALGVVNIAGLKQAINTGAYNFINPNLNSQATRDLIAPTYDVASNSSLVSVDVGLSKSLMELAGGPLMIAVGGQVRHETLENNSLNENLDRYANTSAAFGSHTVSAAFFELNAPVLDTLEVNVSGRYDHYSEGFGRFSPKVGAKWTPIENLSLRGTYSKGFRAPTFAESNPRSSFAGFVSTTPPASFQLAHGGLITDGNTNPYVQSYSVGSGFSGNPNLKPEKSRSFTGGVIFEPTPWLTMSVDYYNIKKTDVIVTGPLASSARAAYFAGNALPAGYTIEAIDGVDPLFPNALPRVLIINAPYVNAASQKTSGIDFAVTARIPLADDIQLISRLDVTNILQFDVDNGDGAIQKFAGTLGPYELSSGAGTPKWRGNWQNTLQFKNFALTATTYYVSRIRAVSADQESPDANGNIDLSCAVAAPTLYPSGASACNIKSFIYADVNAAFIVNDQFTFNVYVGNVTNAKAPLAPASYSGINYLPTWHYAGVIGRTFRAGASFKF